MHMQGVWPLPSMPSPDEVQSEAQASTSQGELTRDVWDLISDHLQEVLEALQTKMAKRGAAPLLGLSQGNPRAPRAMVKL